MDIRQDNETFARHFGLRHNPFSTAGGFQFFRARRREVLEQLIHFSRYSELMLAVTGPRGSGKTVLRHAVAAASKEAALNVVVSALKNSDAAGIAQQLAYALQSTNADIMSLLHAVEQAVLAGKNVQLLVDDAEALEGSALALLQRLGAGSGEARCKVFLFGEPALQSILQDQSAEEDGFEYHLVELEPWQDDEVEEYLQQRLQSAGRDLDLFTDAELATLLEQGQGWPGVINQVAQELLLARMQGREKAPVEPAKKAGKPVLPYRHLVALLVVAFLFILAWYQLDDSKARQQQQQEQQAAPESQSPAKRAPRTEQRITLELPAGEPTDSQAAEQTLRVAEQAQQPAPAPAPAQVAEPVASRSKPEERQVQIEETKPAVVEKPVVQPKPKQAQQPVTRQPVKQPEPPKPKVAATVAKQREAGAGNWYAAQPAQSYTLQLFATSSEQNARQFVQANGSQFHYFRKVHQGQQLFVVTHGRFDNVAAARAAVERLPESLRRNKPWPRTFASIRQEMR